jgi:cytoskeleton protein RodZ
MSEHEPSSNTAGEQLRAARESAGWSVEEVALKLKLSTRQIVAIESEDWDALPERTFTRGFFRSYARLVGIDEALVEKSFARPSATPELLPRSESVGEVTMSNTTARSGLSRWLIPLALFACLCAGVAWMLWHDTPMPQTSSKLPLEVAANAAKQNAEKAGAASGQLTTQSPNEKGVEAQKTSVLNNNTIVASPIINGAHIAEANPPAASGATVPTGLLATVPAAVPSVTPAPATAPAQQAVAPPAPAANAALVAATTAATDSNITLTAGQKRVSLVVKGRAWTEVRSRGEIVISEMLSDTTREIASRGPISFVIGNSSNVTLMIDGKPYDFSMHVRNEVARFRIE